MAETKSTYVCQHKSFFMNICIRRWGAVDQGCRGSLEDLIWQKVTPKTKMHPFVSLQDNCFFLEYQIMCYDRIHRPWTEKKKNIPTQFRHLLYFETSNRQSSGVQLFHREFDNLWKNSTQRCPQPYNLTSVSCHNTQNQSEDE